MRKLRASILMAVILTLVGVSFHPALAAGGGSASTGGTSSMPTVEVQKTPQQIAADHYNSGLRLRDKAWKLEEKAAAAHDEAERGKLLAKMEKRFEKAVEQFTKATETNPSMHQAWSSLGYAKRRLGDYESSLAAYDKALRLAPNYSEAIEYRAEAYLGLDRLDKAKEAYMHLFSHDRPRADELLAAMQKWVEKRQLDPGGLAAEQIESFSAWVAERAEVAEQVADTSMAAKTSSW